MSQSEVEPISSPEVAEEHTTEEQAFAGIGLPFDILKTLSPEGIRVPHPIRNRGINFFLGNAYIIGEFTPPERWETALDAADEIPNSLWQDIYDDGDGKETVNAFLADELRVLLGHQGIGVGISFVEVDIDGEAQEFMEVKPRALPKIITS